MLKFKNQLLALLAIWSIAIVSCQSPSQKETSVENTSIISDCSFLNQSDTTGISCGQILVPENHTKPNGKKIVISYVVLKSRNPQTTEYPMIHFTGGPGGQALRNVTQGLGNPILENRDIIRFDQRGIGYSSALPDLTSRIYGLFPQDLTSDEEREKMDKLISDLRLEVDSLGIEIEMYNTFQNAKDVGMLMDHLGYEKYNLRGGSYGTRIARVVADYFPEKINAAIYDSPAPHKDDYLTTRMDDYSAALRKVFDYCKYTPDCNNAYPNLEESYYEVLNRLNSNPMVVEVFDEPYVLNPQDAIFSLRYELYRNDSRERAPKFIDALYREDTDWVGSVIGSRGMTSSNFAMFLACENYEEYDPGVTTAVVEAKYDTLKEMPYKLALFNSLYLGSKDFLKSYASTEMKEYKVSEIPSLIFINQYDPVTPPINAVIFASKMTRAHSFVIDAGGHGGGDMNCKRAIMDQFMSDPSSELDPDCLILFED